MTDAELKQWSENLQQLIATGKTYTGLLSPEATVYLTMGQIAAKLLPELYTDISAMISGKSYTAEEEAAVALKIKALANPETIQ